MNDKIILDFEWFAPKFLKIQTKINGLRPLNLTKVQARYVEHLKTDFKDGIIRSIVLKPRQSGFSTLIAAINMHKMLVHYDERGMMMADKLARTREVFTYYDTFKNTLNPMVLPRKHQKDASNTKEIYFESRRSGFKAETQNDPHAGRSGSRKWAHLTEYAFYSNAEAIDDGVQNSIPLAKGTRIFKESTAFGVAGVGKAYYEQWEAAVRGDSIYKPFFAAWFEVDDYSLDHNIELTKEEIEIMKQDKRITVGNMAWRRLKLKEYSASSVQIFTPRERFAQDFPTNPLEAFLSSGQPVFNQEQLRSHILALQAEPHRLETVKFTKTYLTAHQQNLKVYQTPQKGERYIIGADVAEGLAHGDASTAFVMTRSGRQVATFTGRLDPDHFGHLLVELARIYKEALIVPEINAMGMATLAAIKNDGYLKVYMRSVYDEIGKVEIKKMGWKTTSQNKQHMLSQLIRMYRDNDIGIYDPDLLREMMGLSRESDGDVELNSKDRTVAACLACIGLEQVYEEGIVYNPNASAPRLYEKRDDTREHALRTARLL